MVPFGIELWRFGRAAEALSLAAEPPIRWTARRTSAAKPPYPVARSATVVRYRENLEPIRELHVDAW